MSPHPQVDRPSRLAIATDIVPVVADLLLRDVPADVLAAVDGHAKRLGLSRAAYLRRVLERERAAASRSTSSDDLDRVTRLAADLDDPDVMSGAWS